VISGGKSQKSLTVGWEVLGLNKETATRIFELEAEEGFMTDREKMYGGQSRKYDKKGNIIKEGDIADSEAAKAEEEETEEETSSNVYECSECGYTLFIAKGREFKFYGDDFACPECGAGKDKFQGRNIEAE
jgi:rubredoxin